MRIASRGLQTYNASNGDFFAETITRKFFGYQPDFLRQRLVPDPKPRGFQGQLLNVQQGNQFFNISSNDQGIQVTPAQ
jgi:hypothetical protein